MNYQVFISYRRNGTDAHARLFYEKLKEKGYNVFLDFESLFSGGFPDNIIKAIDECTDFVLCLSKDGLDRCCEEDDMMKLEIVRAIEGKKNIIPVFIDGFKMPDKAGLCDELKELADKNGVVCSMEYFDSVVKKLVRHLQSHPADENLFVSLERLQSKILSLQHPYFRKWAAIKINDFVYDNEDFFKGRNTTNPHAEDTFGVNGIEFTQKNLKALTVVGDYWEDGFAIKYLQTQRKMIDRGVTIERVFVIDKNHSESALAQMRYQKKLGIDVYFIQSDNEFIDPLWLKEDYLIQDDELLVEIFCESHKFNGQTDTCEHITMTPLVVQSKIERFNRILERAEKFNEE